jgi:cytochrome c biogenesis protein CcmG/thiol:disulfide interchange protein DsbE
MTPNKLWALLPVAFFAALAILFMRGLEGDPQKLPSTLINKPAPALTLPALAGSGVPGIDARALAQGKVTVVNVFASWCVPCRQEHPVLLELAKSGKAELVGINYKDNAESALDFLQSLGSPYSRIGVDLSGRAGIEWGVYGVPETFIVDGKGTIRRKFVGPLTFESLSRDVFPAITEATTP